MSKFLDISINRINTLDVKLIPSATRVFNRCQKEDIPIYIVWGVRTKQEQDLIFRYGRTIPGKVLTMNRGGYSPHQYGLALDFCLLYHTQLLSWEEAYTRRYWRHKWIKVIKYFEEEGWASKWRGYDFEPGHVENLLDYNILKLNGHDVRNSR